MKYIFWSFFLLCMACGNNTSESPLYQTLKEVSLTEVIYEVTEFDKGTIRYDTIFFGKTKDGYLSKADFIRDDGTAFELYELWQRSEDVFLEIYFNYQKDIDSIIYVDSTKRAIEGSALFMLDDKPIVVYKTLDCRFCKSKPNAINYSTDEFGLIMSNTNNSRSVLKEFVDVSSIVRLDSLIRDVKRDTLFYTSKIVID